MQISTHAIRRYKQRVGCKRSSKEKAIQQIKSEIHKNTIGTDRRNNHLYIYTKKFTAVVQNNMIITILPVEPIKRHIVQEVQDIEL